MAHGDYHCCAICDCKMAYADYDARTKEGICTGCLRSAHGAGVMVYTGAELEAWINKNPDKAREILPSLGFSECFYPNPVDAAFKSAAPSQEKP